MSWEGLVAAIITNTPPLPGALCRRQSVLFDAVNDDHARQAAELCQRCPALQQCGEWAATLKHNQRHGVLAGQYHEWASHPSVIRNRRTGDQP
jgi:hypothetical protein